MPSNDLPNSNVLYSALASKILAGLVLELTEYFALRERLLEREMELYLNKIEKDERAECDPNWLADQYRNLLLKLLDLMSISETQLKIYIHQYNELVEKLEALGR